MTTSTIILIVTIFMLFIIAIFLGAIGLFIQITREINEEENYGEEDRRSI